MGKSSGGTTVGYKYFFGIHMGIGRGPVDEILEVQVGGKTAWQGSITDSGDTEIDAPQLFGGDQQEGGVAGTMSVMMGKPDQTAIGALVSMLGHALPGFRGMCTAFFNGTVCSNSPYPQAWTFRVRRSKKGWADDNCWYPDKATIELTGDADDTGDSDTGVAPPNTSIAAMNPAHIIYECLTNRQWGRGLPSTALNIPSFTTAADTLFDEGFGLCLRWTRTDTILSFAQSVVDHIGAVIYSDPQTALITLKLIRGDYDPNSLPVFDSSSGLVEIQEADVSALGPGVNQIQVQYTDALTGLTGTGSAQNLASLKATGGVFNSLVKQYPGIPNLDLANRVAQRELKTNAMPLRKFTLICDRRAWNIPPAGLIRIKDLQRGIGDMVLRVGRVEGGTLQDGKITITAVQDVFSFPLTSFIGIEPPKWVQPNTVPAIKRHETFEVPYFMLAANMSAADFAYVGKDDGYIGTVVEKPTPLSLNYQVYVKIGASDSSEIPPTPAPTTP